MLPSVLFYQIAKAFINWRSLALTGLFMGFISLFWEGAIAVPYQWWDYEHSQMIGVFVGPLANLPIEAMILWVASAWCAIISYETVQVFLRMNSHDIRSLLFGPTDSTS